MSLYKSKILGTGSSLPENVMTNFDFEKIIDTSDEWIVSRTGIKERRIATNEESTSTFAARAAVKAMEAAGVTAEEIDLIVLGTLTSDMICPSTACVVQDMIGAKNAAAFDLSAACSGFVYGLSIANQFVSSGTYNKVLVIGAETMSKVLDFQDRNTCVLFGDGAGAVIVGRSDDESGFEAFELGADGSGAKSLHIPAGGSAKPTSAETVANREQYLQMEGTEVFKFAVRTMGASSLRVIEKAGHTVDELDYLVPHQANSRIIASAMKKLKLSEDKVKINLDKYGNMSGASIPVALDEAVREGSIKKGDKLVMVGFGAGLTWGSCFMVW